MKKTLSLLIVAMGLMLGGCAGTYAARTTGGGELTLFFNPGLQVYTVQSYPDVYYSRGVYYRPSGRYWVRSHAVRGPWERCSYRQVPPGLRDRYGHHEDRDRGHRRSRH